MAMIDISYYRELEETAKIPDNLSTSLLNAYFDSIARTEIKCTICLSDSSWDNHQ